MQRKQVLSNMKVVIEGQTSSDAKGMKIQKRDSIKQNPPSILVFEESTSYYYLKSTDR